MVYRHWDTLIGDRSASYRIQENGEQGGYRHRDTLIGEQIRGGGGIQTLGHT